MPSGRLGEVSRVGLGHSRQIGFEACQEPPPRAVLIGTGVFLFELQQGLEGVQLGHKGGRRCRPARGEVAHGLQELARRRDRAVPPIVILFGGDDQPRAGFGLDSIPLGLGTLNAGDRGAKIGVDGGPWLALQFGGQWFA
jgi:hypothetical protein